MINNSTVANSRKPHCGSFITGTISITKKVYLSVKNSVLFPQRRPAGDTLAVILRQKP